MSPFSSSSTAEWQLPMASEPPQWLIEVIQHYTPGAKGTYGAQLLWQRGLRDRPTIEAFLQSSHYSPANAFEWGEEMRRAVTRLQTARENQENVAIWGDFDADGVTATAVLWEGLGHWFYGAESQPEILSYYIPDRFTESHGLSETGIRQLADQGVRLIVTCDTGSSDTAEIELAQSLGIDVIVTDHHTLPPGWPEQRPPVVALINPRSLPPEHPLADLSGVAVAYKLIEALQQTRPMDPDPLPHLLELVSIGLIADLVALRNDSRYLAQEGLKRLQALMKSPQHRPGVAALLKRCQRSGDRPTDISFGIGPRINAVSRIQGDARLCVELLTSRDVQRCQQLVEAVELLNTRRKALQQRLAKEVRSRLQDMDLSTTAAIVLAEVGWPLGVLGLVASEIAREFGRPTVLLSLDPPEVGEAEATGDDPPVQMARGSARSVHQIDFYPVLASQRSLLTRFGGHPYAAGMSLPAENLELFAAGLNQELRSRLTQMENKPPVIADLVVTVSELGPLLFKELKLLEPCGMGNPVPMLLIRRCRFQQVRNFNIKDAKGGKVRYIKTQFQILDDSAQQGFPGLWWGHYQDELPQGMCDAVGELDFNAYHKQYEFRLVAVRAVDSAAGEALSEAASGVRTVAKPIDWLLDWRRSAVTPAMAPAVIWEEREELQELAAEPLLMEETPETWADFRPWLTEAQQQTQPLALAYGGDDTTDAASPQKVWLRLLGIAKYLSRTGEEVEIRRIRERLGVSEPLMELGWGAIADLGFEAFHPDSQRVRITRAEGFMGLEESEAIAAFVAALQEAWFRRQYFLEAPVDEIGSVVTPMLRQDDGNQNV